MVEMVIMVRLIIMVAMVIMVTKVIIVTIVLRVEIVIMVEMVIIVEMVIMVRMVIMATNVIMITDRTDKTDICIGQLLQSLRCFVCNGALQCVPLFRLQYIFFSFATGSQKISLVLQWAERVSSMPIATIA